MFLIFQNKMYVILLSNFVFDAQKQIYIYIHYSYLT